MAAPGGNIPADATLLQRWAWAFRDLSHSFDWRHAAHRTRRLVLESQPRHPAGTRQRDHRIPVVYFPVQRFARAHAGHAVDVVHHCVGGVVHQVTRTDEPRRMGRDIWHRRVDDRRVEAHQHLGSVHILPVRGAGSGLSLSTATLNGRDRFNLPDWLGRALFSHRRRSGFVPARHVDVFTIRSLVQPGLQQSGPVDSLAHAVLLVFHALGTVPLYHYGVACLGSTRMDGIHAGFAFEEVKCLHLLIEIGLAVVLALFAFFIMEGVRIALVALPLAVWRDFSSAPEHAGVKRGVLLMIGTGLALTMAVEVITLRGDIGRMNTIFKLYMQAWMLFAVSAAAAFGWLLDAFPIWTLRWRTIYQTGLYLFWRARSCSLSPPRPTRSATA